MNEGVRRKLIGYVEIEAAGGEQDRFLRLAVNAGAELWDVHRTAKGQDAHADAAVLTFSLSADEVSLLWDAARACNVRLRIKKRYGLPFLLLFFRRRPALLAGLVLGLFAIVFFSSLVMELTVTSPEELPAEDALAVYAAADAAGLRCWHSRWWMDLEAAEEEIRRAVPSLYYVEVLAHGVTLEVQVVRRIDVPEDDRIRPPGHIVAAAAGVIRAVLVNRGTAAVAPGDAVQPGDILIESRFNRELAAASGIVTAEVYASGYGEQAETRIVCRDTGAASQSVAIRIKDGAAITLLGKRESDYVLSRREQQSTPLCFWRKFFLPVELILDTVYEQEAVLERCTPQQAAAAAREAAKANALAAYAAQCGKSREDPDLSWQDIYLGDGIYRCRAVAQGETEIGSYRQLTAEEEAAYAAADEEARLQAEHEKNML